MGLPRHIIAYHYVISGRCLVKVEGEPPVMVEGGEIVVLPRNDEHVLGSTLSIRAVNGEDLV